MVSLDATVGMIIRTAGLLMALRMAYTIRVRLLHPLASLPSQLRTCPTSQNESILLAICPSHLTFKEYICTKSLPLWCLPLPVLGVPCAQCMCQHVHTHGVVRVCRGQERVEGDIALLPTTHAPSR